MPAFATPAAVACRTGGRRALAARRPSARRPRCGGGGRRSPAAVRCAVAAPSVPPRDEFGGWSAEFTTLCQEQLELVQTTVPHVASATLFFRREHRSGDLEFVPLATHPHDPRVWISSGAPATTAVPRGSRVLPGGIPADWVLPGYPFLNRDAQQGSFAADGSLCVPIMFSSVVAGSLVLWRLPSVPPGAAWPEADVSRVRIVARTIALAAALEGRWLAASQQMHQDAALLQSLGEIIRSTVHQIRSPITALVTFGRMLMQRLPPGDANRSLAKSIVVEGFRLDDLLSPLDRAGERVLSLPAGVLQAERGDTDGEVGGGDGDGDGSGFGGGRADGGGDVDVKPLTRELFWVSDMLAVVADTTRALAESRGLTFIESVDEDAPPVLGHEQSMREVIHNCLDNALKYTPRGGAVGLCAGSCRRDANEVEIVVWDSGPGILPDEMERVWQRGKRGTAGLLNGSTSGSGLGLTIAKDLVDRQQGHMSLQSPIPPAQLARLTRNSNVDYVGPGTLCRVTMRRSGQ